MQCLHCSKGSELCNINSDFGWRTLESLSLNLFGWLLLGSYVAAWLSSAAERSENKCYCIALRSSPALHQRWPKVLVTAYEALHLIDLWVGSVQRGAPILLQPLLQSLNFSLSIQLKQRWWMSCYNFQIHTRCPRCFQVMQPLQGCSWWGRMDLQPWFCWWWPQEEWLCLTITDTWRTLAEQ